LIGVGDEFQRQGPDKDLKKVKNNQREKDGQAQKTPVSNKLAVNAGGNG
jgi:hypothetical protein